MPATPLALKNLARGDRVRVRHDQGTQDGTVTALTRGADCPQVTVALDDGTTDMFPRRAVTRLEARTADTAYLAAVAEARAILARIESGLDASPVRGVHWGHVGSLEEVTRHLKLAAHYAGVGDEAWADL